MKRRNFIVGSCGLGYALARLPGSAAAEAPIDSLLPLTSKNQWSLYQDQLVLDATLASWLVSEIDAGRIARGAMLTIAARTLQVVGPIVIPYCSLVLLADVMLASGTINLRSVRSTDPPPRPRLMGAIAPNFVALCMTFAGSLEVVSIGGTGGPGTTGVTGTNGVDGCGRAFSQRNLDCSCIDATDGSPGGQGTPGSKGGWGGNVAILAVRNRGTQAIHNEGGPGGSGGPGGKGGMGGWEGHCYVPREGYDYWTGLPNAEIVNGSRGGPGAKGPVGLVGAQGATGSRQVSTLSEAEYWKAAHKFAPGWAAHRARVGEYLLRSYGRTANPAATIKSAGQEFRAALKLDPTCERAQLQLAQFEHAQNVLGQPYGLDIVPDFEQFERQLTAYAPFFLDAFANADTFALAAVSGQQQLASIQREVARLIDAVQVLVQEQQIAELESAAAQLEATHAYQHLQAMEQLVDNKVQQLQNAGPSIGDIALGVGIVAASTIAAIASAGTAIPAVPAAVIYLAKTVPNVDYAAEFGKPSAERKQIEELKKNGADLAGAANAVKNGLTAVISIRKLVDDIRNTPDMDLELQRLLIDQAEATHRVVLANLQMEQAALTARLQATRLAHGRAELDRARAQLNSTASISDRMQQVAVALYRSAQLFSDEFSRIFFKACRALEIYALADLSRKYVFDFGHVHPDIEEKYRSRLLGLDELAARYRASASRFGNDLLSYRNQYEAYFTTTRWIRDSCRITITDAAALERFRRDHRLGLTIHQGLLNQNRREMHVIKTVVSLVGATSESGLISLVVSHAGNYTVWNRTGLQIDQVLSAKSAVVGALLRPLSEANAFVLEEDLASSARAPRTLQYWGRGLATHWEIRLEEAEFMLQRVDLSRLAKIEFWMIYDGVLTGA